MPPKIIENYELKLFYRASDGEWMPFGNLSDVELSPTEKEISVPNPFVIARSFTVCVKMISGSNKLRLHGKRPYRMRTYWKWQRRYEIHCRTAYQ